MMDTEAFREFKTGLTLLRDNYANKALPHMRKAVDLDKNNPYYMSYLGVVLARSEQKWGGARAMRLCRSHEAQPSATLSESPRKCMPPRDAGMMLWKRCSPD